MKLTQDQQIAVSAALWLVLRDEATFKAYIDLCTDNRDNPQDMVEACRVAYNIINGLKVR